MKTDFAELGIPFPLYEAPVAASDDSDFAGEGTCCLCGTQQALCFRLGVGDGILIPCPSCATVNGLSVCDKAPVACRNCGGAIPFPAQVAAKKEPKTCYQCLRAGKAALTKGTEFGMISWQQAFVGVTNGVPGLQQDQFESVVLDDDEEWRGVRLPSDMMFELLRTPTYGSWQGERWLFCCRYPMTFLGEWQHEDFERRAGDSHGAQLYSTLADVPESSWDALGQGLCVYVFECKQCGQLRAHHDCD